MITFRGTMGRLMLSPAEGHFLSIKVPESSAARLVAAILTIRDEDMQFTIRQIEEDDDEQTGEVREVHDPEDSRGPDA